MFACNILELIAHQSLPDFPSLCYSVTHSRGHSVTIFFREHSTESVRPEGGGGEGQGQDPGPPALLLGQHPCPAHCGQL